MYDDIRENFNFAAINSSEPLFLILKNHYIFSALDFLGKISYALDDPGYTCVLKTLANFVMHI